MTALHPETHIGLVALTVANRERSVAFYQDVLGFTVGESGKADVILAAEATAPLLLLTEQAGARPRPSSTVERQERGIAVRDPWNNGIWLSAHAALPLTPLMSG